MIQQMEQDWQQPQQRCVADKLDPSGPTDARVLRDAVAAGSAVRRNEGRVAAD
jgi:hypothetical protein